MRGSMVQIIVVSIPVIVFVIYFAVMSLNRKKREKRRASVSSQEFPEEWNGYLEKHFELFKYMPESLQEKLRRYILIFIDEKEFMGSGGLELTDEMKVVVSAQALLLILGMKKPHFYPKLYIIELYPAAYKTMAHDGVTVSESVRLGESWQGGRLVLSWEHSRQGKYAWNDGSSVVVHEFAHRLDQLSGRADGAPVLDEARCYSVWSEVMSREYDKMLKTIEKRDKYLLDEYGATNPAEFFAVATEVFFERPLDMKEQMPEVYGMLKYFYKLDPAKWIL